MEFLFLPGRLPDDLGASVSGGRLLRRSGSTGGFSLLSGKLCLFFCFFPGFFRGDALLFRTGEEHRIFRYRRNLCIDLKEAAPGEFRSDGSGIEPHIFPGKFLKLGHHFLRHLRRGRSRGIVAEDLLKAVEIFPHIRLIGPVVEILDGEHVFVVLFAHFRSQYGLCNGESDGIAGGVPAVVGGDGVEKVLFPEELHEGIVRAVGEVDVEDRNGNAAVMGGGDAVHEFGGAFLEHAEVAELAGFACGCEGRIDGEKDVGLFRGHDAAYSGNVLGDGAADLLTFIAGDGVLRPAEGIQRFEAGLEMIVVHMIAGDEEERQLVGAGEGAVYLFGEALCILFQVARLEGGLGIPAAVVEAEAEVGEYAVFHVLDKAFIDDGIFRAPFKPVLKVFRGDGELQRQELRRFGRCDGAGVHFVLQAGDAVNGGAVVRIVVGLHAAAGGIRGAHDGAEGVDGHVRMGPVERAEPVGPVREDLEGFIVLAGVHQPSVDEGIRGEDGRIGAVHILLHPVPDAVRGALIVPAGKQIGWRGDHGIARLFRGIGGVGEAHGPVVLGNEKNGFRRGGQSGEGDRTGYSGGQQQFRTLQNENLLS